MQKNIQAIADHSLALTLLPFEHWAQWTDFFVQQPKTWMTVQGKPLKQTQAESSIESPVELDPSETVDDLTRISGVGPKLAKKLNRAGVTRFVQIAELSDEDIEQLERDVVGFKGRIKRDDWQSQARQFMLDV